MGVLLARHHIHISSIIGREARLLGEPSSPGKTTAVARRSGSVADGSMRRVCGMW